LQVAVYGPARPKSGAAVQSCEVDALGRFRIRVPPGRNYPYLVPPDFRMRMQQGETLFEEGVKVKAGETVQLEFRIRPKGT
jgi:hypothetical protein